MSRYKYPCTGKVDSTDFPNFLGEELNSSRRNIKLLAEELITLLNAPYITLVNSGSSANLVAAIVVKELQPKRTKVILSGFSFPTTISANFGILDEERFFQRFHRNIWEIFSEELKFARHQGWLYKEGNKWKIYEHNFKNMSYIRSLFYSPQAQKWMINCQSVATC